MKVGLICLGYCLVALLTSASCRYHQFAHPEEWGPMPNEDQMLVTLAAGALWPAIWFLVLPIFVVLTKAEALGDRARKAKALAAAEQREVERAMRELE